MIEVECGDARIDLSVEETGTSESFPVVILHGWGSSAALMRPIAEWLSPSCHVLNMDLPGHGFSPMPPKPWGVKEYADAVHALVEQLVSGPYAIVGHSNGGRIALFMASDERLGEHLSRLALISPSGTRRRRTVRITVKRLIATLLKAPFQILPDGVRDFGLDWLRHSLVWRLLGSSDYRSLDGVMRETFVRTVNTYVEDRLADVHIPVLLFRGDRDDDISMEQMQILTSRIEDSGLVSVPDAGHYAFIDQPDLVRAGLLEFLRTT